MSRSLSAVLHRWKCPSCATLTTTSRVFTTAATYNSQVKPESPRYIPVPESVQKDRRRASPVKGTLPVPRDIFPSDTGGTSKITPSYLDAATRTSARPAGPSPTAADAARADWKHRLASHRRRNLRSGLAELAERRRRHERSLAARKARGAAERRRLNTLPERADERLTRASTTEALAPFRGAALPDPNREERVAAMRARVADKEARRAEDRRMALHTLYMRARDFIVSEEQLDKHIDVVFGTPDSPAPFANRGQSVWSQGAPATVEKRLQKAVAAQRGYTQDEGIRGRLGQRGDPTTKRLGRIAEELTGGKMDSNL